MLLSRYPGVGLSNAAPMAPGTPAPGTSTLAARADHVHPPSPIQNGVAGVLEYLTTPSTAVLQAVYLSQSDTVEAASASAPATAPAVGFIQAKPSAVNAVVQYSGAIDGFSGLTPGATYFLGLTPGTITTDVSAYPTGAIVQRVGYAEDLTTLVIQLDRDYTIL